MAEHNVAASPEVSGQTPAPGPDPSPNDITELILDDHEWFRRAFARLDDLQAGDRPPADLTRVWAPLAGRLDAHAIAEEEIFYPQLLRKGADAREETLDAIGDHNDIRDGVHEADAEAVGSPAWWEAVGRARVANDEHMAEEEREGLADFRMHATAGLREALGRRFREFMTEHGDASDLDTSDKDPQEYVDTQGDAGPPDTTARDTTARDTTTRPADHSLGIGSLKGR